MYQDATTNITALLKQLCNVLQPAASKRNIELVFDMKETEISINQPEQILVNGFTKLIVSIIDYMPDGNTLYIITEANNNDGTNQVSIKIRNTGINLRQVLAIINKSVVPVKLFSSAEKETTFEVCYSLLQAEPEPNTQQMQDIAFNYLNFLKGIKTHFSRLNNAINRLAETKPAEADFLGKINACIFTNLDNEDFDANELSNAMAMSRAQLLRRLKSITGNSPAYYIKNLRLTRAKELLETTDITISEAAFQTGFNTPSNFSKVFNEKYGITPSQCRCPGPRATNE